ncbi:lysine 2,3-aminomutase [Sodalis-like endosymbiont of Proechinophthirus fluctus]|uniref:EF-P beta-lysylation protein EpmB n=1 Tax=Sodalis-like endosymbiont of Proechinophthirus fluctus TaxID=1462730 RepID=UPI0007A82ABA|nr:EF-P beta-lysylation protein EpmB [Sodalis-like endosymbiont of Proechinophthirus fluctus]KYP96346.1 lysine 2,3-aminomutase [Sodalis-like endosymbiont of Proechinophthirus fluctus]
MARIIIRNTPAREEWLYQLDDVITDPVQLLELLRLGQYADLREGAEARRLFPFRVPRTFAARMIPGDPGDPLLRQVITVHKEFDRAPGFSTDPLDEQHSVIPGLLHKYHNRALMLVKGGCAVNCRYCFRRHFPYQKNHGNKTNWLRAMAYIQQHSELNEIILSGGDPLMAKDHELDELICLLEKIPHLTTLRIHSRLPIVIPARITERLCRRLAGCRLKVVLVTHINHAREIDTAVCNSMTRLRNTRVTLLNQSVLLRGVNDNADTLAALSETLFAAGILPYYLHVLDRVQGAAHFMVHDTQAREIMRQLLEKVSGYLVPRLTREIGGERSKTLLDLGLRQF